MTETSDKNEHEEKSPTEAFDELRREVAFMRKAIERMADDQRAAPDYSETLGQMADGLANASKALGWLTGRPIIKTTAEQMAREIGEAGNVARAADGRALAEAAQALKEANLDLKGWIASARKADDQEHQLWHFSIGAAGIGAVVAVLLTIVCFRLFPEHSAVWLLGKDRWNAGQQLMTSADPERWAELQHACDKERANPQAIANRQKSSKRSH